MIRVVTKRGGVAAVAVLMVWVMPAWAQQPASSFVQLKDNLIGHAVTVTDNTGRRLSGQLSDISETSLRLVVDGTPRSFSAEEVRRIQQRRADRLTNGLLIGAGVGAGYALYWYIRDPNECGGTVCGSDLTRGVAIGAAIGVAVDAVIRENVTLYLASGSADAGHRTLPVGPAGMPIRAAVAVRW